MLPKMFFFVLALVLLLPSPAQAVTIDPARTGTIVLQFADPKLFDDAPGPSAVGVGARVQRLIDADLATHEGWSTVAALRATELFEFDDSAFDVSRTGHSNQAGTVTFPNLPLGLYRITPLDRDTFVSFALALPTSSRDSRWEYTVHAYPKVSGGPEEPEAPEDGDNAPPSGGDHITSQPTPPPGGGAAGPGPGDSMPGKNTPSGPERGVPGGLASTGASILGFAAVGLLLLLLGTYLILRKRRGAADEEI